MLEDGDYDAMVVDAVADRDAIALELAVTSGPHKGEVVALRAVGLVDDVEDEIGVLGLLAMPGTLRVENGEPAFVLDW